MKVKNITLNNGNKIANQFIITDNHKMGNKIEYFQSYNSIIVKRIYDNIGSDVVETFLDSKYWNYSTTTSKYRNIFLGEKRKDTEKKIKQKIYILTDLNKGLV